jgi:drug/metabolite transporter (DMT)-like permease
VGVNLSTGGGLLAIVLWSTTFALARSLSEQVGAFTGATAVYLTAGFLGLARLSWHGNPIRRLQECSRKYVLGCGGLFALYSLLVYVAVGLAGDREELLEVALINYLWPAGTVLLAVPLLGQRAGVLLLPGTIIALAGVSLVITEGAGTSGAALVKRLGTHPLPLLFAFLAALSWALYSNLTRRWAGPKGQGAVEWFMAATGVLLLVLRAFWPEHGAWTAKSVLEAATLGSVTALAYALWDVAMRKGNLLLVACVSYFTPLLSTLVSGLYLRVVPSSRLWLGATLLAAGSLLSWLSLRGRPSESRPAESPQ